MNKKGYKTLKAKMLKYKLKTVINNNNGKYNNIPVFIPSICLGERSRFIWRILKEKDFVEDRQIFLVIRKKEEKMYKKLGLNYLIRSRKDESLVGAKNFIINYCRKNNIDDCIIVDDDVFAYNFEKEISPRKTRLSLKDCYRILEYFIKSTNSKLSTTSPGSSFYPYLEKESIVCSRNNGSYLWHFHIPTFTENKFVFDSAKNCGREDTDMLIQMRFAGIKINKFILIAHPGNHDESGTVNHAVSYDDMAIILNKKWGNEFVTSFNKKFKKQVTTKSRINFNKIDKIASSYGYDHRKYLKDLNDKNK